MRTYPILLCKIYINGTVSDATPVLGNLLVKINVTDISHYHMNLFRFLIRFLTFFHTTIKMPVLQTIELTLPKNDLNKSIRGQFDQEIEILPSKCGKWKLGGTKLWKVEIRGYKIVESGN